MSELSVIDAIAQVVSEGANKLITDGGEISRTFMNAVTGQGFTSRDRAANWSVNPAQLLTTDAERTLLFHRDYMARRIVDLLPKHALKKPFRFESKSDKETAEKVSNAINPLRPVARKAWILSRNYGGAVIVMGLTGDSREPAKPNEWPRWFQAVDRRYVSPSEFGTDVNAEDYGLPRTWNIANPIGSTSIGRTFHRSRLVFFPGLETTDDVSAALGFWQISIHDLAIQALADFHGAWANANNLLTSSHQGVFKIKGFAQLVASRNREAAIARIQIVDMYRSILRAIVVDKDGEDFEYKTAPLTGAADLMQQFQQMIAAVARTPLTVLMGQSPSGMNATGESDLRLFADMVDEDRDIYLTPILKEFGDRYARSIGKPALPFDVEIKYPSVWQSTPAEAATIRKTNAESDKVQIDAQVYLPEEVALFRSSNGYETDLTLTAEGEAVRKKALAELYAPKPSETDPTGATGGTGENDPNEEAEASGTKTPAIEPNPDGSNEPGSEVP